MRIQENWRNSEGGFDTDIKCSCGRQTEVYVDIQYARVCKGCLGEIENRINDAYMKHIRESKRL
jgi:hypothetical protein